MQLVAVSINKAASKVFLYYTKRLELNKQLAYIFFNKCYIAITDTLYKKQLREL